MSKVVRIPLPNPLGGFYPITDTNYDHFSLISDSDNVLIKRFATGQPTVTDGTDLNLIHGLGYIPFFVSFYSPQANGKWMIFNNGYNAFSDVDACAIDTNKLVFHNAGGHASGNLQPTYDIFYDDMSTAGSALITELAGSKLFKVARPGQNAHSLNPNNYIMHSQLNNFKILKQGQVNIHATTGFHTYLLGHNANVDPPYKFFVFLSMPDGKTMMLGGDFSGQHSFDLSQKFISANMDSTNINVSGTWSGTNTILATYIIYGTGKDDNTLISNPIIDVPMPGYNAKTEKNPDHFAFHSRYPTLKYYASGVYDVGTIHNTTTVTIAHNLGYVPFFIGFVNDIVGLIPGGYALMPYYKSNSSIPSPNRNIGNWIYADSTNIYLKTWYDVNATDNYHPIFYYKVFKNNLGL